MSPVPRHSQGPLLRDTAPHAAPHPPLRPRALSAEPLVGAEAPFTAAGGSPCSSVPPAIPGPRVPRPLVSLQERTVARAEPVGALRGAGSGRLLGFCFFTGTGGPGRRWGEGCRPPCSCLSRSWGLKAARGAVGAEAGGSELAPGDPLGPEVRFLSLFSGFIFSVSCYVPLLIAFICFLLLFLASQGALTNSGAASSPRVRGGPLGRRGELGPARLV